MIVSNWITVFFEKQKWNLATTSAINASQEYIAAENGGENDEEFMAAVDYISKNGITMYFLNRPNRYIFFKGKMYWVTGDKINDQTIMINRCNLNEYKLSITRR